MIRDCRPLVHALIDAMLFLECSGDNAVNPDSAVRCMEIMASSLLRLSHSDQMEFRRLLAEIADSADDKRFAEFVRRLPDMLGFDEAG